MTSPTICPESGLSFIDCFCRECGEFREEVARMVRLYDDYPARREGLDRWFDRWGLTRSGEPKARVAA